MTTSNPRTSEYPIDNQFLDRWSPRAFTGEAIPEATLLTFFEAARWAPSCFNSQPWRFIYARRDTEHWDRFLGFLNSFNQGWGQHASAIVIVLSKTTFAAPGTTEEKAAPTHSFDAGAAWGYLALQASLSGWHAHGLGGIEHDKIRKELALPDNYAIEAGVVIGKLGDKSSLPEALQAREVQSPRNPLSSIAIEGRLVP